MDSDLNEGPMKEVEDDDEMDFEGGEEMDSKVMAEGDEKDLTGDGGVKKKLVRAGTGWEQPQKDDKVYMHYTGTLLDGTKFDSSVDRGEPFSFTLGHGQVIKGWDIAVKGMRKGEKILLTLAPKYAYGERGSPPTIPANATLVFEMELLRWESVNDLSPSKDGSVMKKVVKEGDLNVWDRPKDVDIVTVKLSAKVAGAEDYFVRDRVHEFTLEQGYFCPAVKMAVGDMKKGEEVELKVKSKYAFGSTGMEGCPPNSDVVLEVALVAVKTVKNVDPDHMGYVKKIILKDGVAYQTPNDFASVTVSWTGRLDDGSVFDEVTNKAVSMNEDPFPCEALELAVLSMKAEEEAQVVVKDPYFGFGAKGLEGVVPPDAVVTYDVRVLEFKNGDENYDLDVAGKIARATEYKVRGNSAFKAGRFVKARRLYDKVDSLLASDTTFSESEKAEAREVLCSALLNTAAVSLKEQKYKDTVQQCNKVLERKSGSVKALFRRAQAEMELGDLLEAETDLKAALLQEPESKELLLAQKKLKVKMREQNKKDAKLFGAMFSKVGSLYKDHPAKGVTTAADEDEDEDEVPNPVAKERPQDAEMQDGSNENVSANA